MSSAIPAATDYLVKLANQAAAAVDVGTLVDDGWPGSFGPSMFTIGSDRPPDTGAGTATTGDYSWQGLGAKQVDESFTIPCWIYSSSGDTEQSELRKASFALWDAFFPLLRADLTLGGALGSWPAAIASFDVEAPKSAEEAANGRYCLILFTVHCDNRY